MDFMKQVTRVFRSSMIIPFDDSAKFVLMSDCHRGDGSRADDFNRSESIYLYALSYYDLEQYTYIEIGDGDELWENRKPWDIINAHKEVFRLLKKLYDDQRVYFIYGNHDILKRSEKFVKANYEKYYDQREKREIPLFQNVRFYEGLILQYKRAGCLARRDGGEACSILLMHGHQVDFINNRLWRLSRFLVRYFWRPLELFGISNPTSPAQNQEKKESVGRKLYEWVLKEKHMLIAGHNHRPMFPGSDEVCYINDGSWVHPRLITAVEIANGKIQLVKWGIMTREDGGLFIGRTVIDGPRTLRDCFSHRAD